MGKCSSHISTIHPFPNTCKGLLLVFPQYQLRKLIVLTSCNCLENWLNALTCPSERARRAEKGDTTELEASANRGGAHVGDVHEEMTFKLTVTSQKQKVSGEWCDLLLMMLKDLMFEADCSAGSDRMFYIDTIRMRRVCAYCLSLTLLIIWRMKLTQLWLWMKSC